MIAEASKINVDDLVKRTEDKVGSLKTVFQQSTTDGAGRATRQDGSGLGTYRL
jgi:hypothetical protein